MWTTRGLKSSANSLFGWIKNASFYQSYTLIRLVLCAASLGNYVNDTVTQWLSSPKSISVASHLRGTEVWRNHRLHFWNQALLNSSWTQTDKPVPPGILFDLAYPDRVVVCKKRHFQFIFKKLPEVLWKQQRLIPKTVWAIPALICQRLRSTVLSVFRPQSKINMHVNWNPQATCQHVFLRVICRKIL